MYDVHLIEPQQLLNKREKQRKENQTNERCGNCLLFRVCSAFVLNISLPCTCMRVLTAQCERVITTSIHALVLQKAVKRNSPSFVGAFEKCFAINCFRDMDFRINLL